MVILRLLSESILGVKRIYSELGVIELFQIAKYTS